MVNRRNPARGQTAPPRGQTDTSTRDANEKERIKPLLQLIIDKKWDPEEVINHCRQLITDKKKGDAFLLIKHGIGIPHCYIALWSNRRDNYNIHMYINE
jgi:hypothetical protein